MTAPEVVIVGGGVIGLSVAYVLAREGVGTTVLDAGPLGRAASWAGAGILAPMADRPGRHPLSTLRDRSARLHAAWAEALRDETGLDNGYRRSGGVDVACTPEDDHALRAAAGRWREEGIAFERLEPRDFARVEPALSLDLRAAYFLPDRAQIRNPRHLQALALACERRGVRLRPGQAALEFLVNGGRVVAVRTEAEVVSCGVVVVAAGPWSSGLLARVGLSVPTPPIKGQIVLLRGGPGGLTRIVEHGRNYLVPRDDGRVLVGSTEEHAGFDVRSTPGAVRDLLDEALRLCPVLGAAEVERSWAGLRPGSVDGRPYLGRAPGWTNLVVATGHHRAGLQLSPATAEAAADLVLGRPPRLDLTPFRLDREPEGADENAFRS